MRQGFTLLELLMAISMFIILLGIVWSVTSLFSRTETHRAQSAEQQRIVRQWTRILNDDFLSVIQDVEHLNKSVGDETIRHFGVSGTDTLLRVDVSDYSWRTAESSELRTIFYEFHPTSGLTRRERDYADLKMADGTRQFAPEIVSGKFRYSDGGTWHEHWASLDRKSAPRSIEVTFYSLPKAEADQWRSRMSTREPLLNRVTIAIPSATRGHEPYRRAQAPRPPQEERPPEPPAPPPPPRPPTPPPPSPFHSLFGDD